MMHPIIHATAIFHIVVGNHPTDQAVERIAKLYRTFQT